MINVINGEAFEGVGVCRDRRGGERRALECC